MDENAPARMVPLAEVARRLRMSPRRARVLAAESRLPAQKVANRWVVDPRALSSGSRANGRPLSDRNVWGLLFLMSGEAAPWLDAVSRSRLRKRALLRHLRREAPRLARRAQAHYFRSDERALDRISKAADFVPSGAMVAAAHGVDVSGGGVEGYMPESAIGALAYKAALRPATLGSANVVLHGVEGFWPLGGRHRAPIAVALLDLLESGDQRSQRAARSYLKR